jgi:NADH dehydrogenase (ubiquinone) 1 alpha subcomplex subunit 6
MSIHSAFATKLASASSSEARVKVVALFRAAMREADNIIRNYQLDQTRSELRNKIKEEFAKHANVTDTRVIDRLVFKGATELEEAKLLWKTKSHVVRFFVPERAGRSAAEMKRIVAKQQKDAMAQDALPAQGATAKSIPQMFWADKQSSSTL